MDIVCNTATQTFHWGVRNAAAAAIILTQNDDQPIRLYLVRPSPFPGGLFPFVFDPLSSGGAASCIISLRDVRAYPVNLGSTEPLATIRDGFSGVFHLNTQAITNYLGKTAEREIAFCVDMVDTFANKLSPFRRMITLRAIGIDAANQGLTASLFYLPDVTEYIFDPGNPISTVTLESVETSGVAINTIFFVIIHGVSSQWRLEAGTAATDVAAGVVKALDSGRDLVRVGGL
jgi:hypothetical protein